MRSPRNELHNNRCDAQKQLIYKLCTMSALLHTYNKENPAVFLCSSKVCELSVKSRQPVYTAVLSDFWLHNNVNNRPVVVLKLWGMPSDLGKFYIKCCRIILCKNNVDYLSMILICEGYMLSLRKKSDKPPFIVKIHIVFMN